MNIDTLHRLLALVALLLAQVLVLNQIRLFGVATPLLFVMLVLRFPRNIPRWAALLWSFAMGLLVDVFSNTAGVAAASLTLIGFVQPYAVELFAPRDAAADLKPSFHTLSAGAYLLYVVALVLLFCTVYFLLESFTFFNWEHWLLCAGASTVLTTMFILVLDNFRGQ